MTLYVRPLLYDTVCGGKCSFCSSFIVSVNLTFVSKQQLVSCTLQDIQTRLYM